MSTPVNDDRGTRIVVGLTPSLWDNVDITYPDSVTEVYTFTLGTELHVQGVVTLIYQDSTKAVLLKATRTS